MKLRRKFLRMLDARIYQSLAAQKQVMAYHDGSQPSSESVTSEPGDAKGFHFAGKQTENVLF